MLLVRLRSEEDRELAGIAGHGWSLFRLFFDEGRAKIETSRQTSYDFKYEYMLAMVETDDLDDELPY